MRLAKLSTGGIALLLLAATAAADDAEEIKKLIPAASGMARADFEKLARADTALSDIDEKTLTLLVFTAKPRDDAKAKEQFRFLTPGYPKPSQLATEMYRSLNLAGTTVVFAPVTMIQADRITGLTCDVKEGVAKGTVSFEVPKLYAGKVDYVARKVDGAWRIEELAMPGYEIHVVRGEKGKWKEK
jgi:hypothetical protein